MRRTLAIGLAITVLLTGGCSIWDKMTGKKTEAPPPTADDGSDVVYVGSGQVPTVTYEPTGGPPPPTDTGVTHAPPAPVGSGTVEMGPVAAPPAPAPTVGVGPGAHIVRRGDTLWSIAQQYYGNGARWPDIARANGISNPKKLAVGQQITLP